MNQNLYFAVGQIDAGPLGTKGCFLGHNAHNANAGATHRHTPTRTDTWETLNKLTVQGSKVTSGKVTRRGPKPHARSM